MNILIDRLPNEYEGLKIDTNFRSFILFELLMQDNELTQEEKIFSALKLFFDNFEIENMQKYIECILWFYSMGKTKEDKKTNKKSKEKKEKAIYSYEHDANLIYSAFLSQYGVDLNEVDNLHWWKFKSMFEGLNEENKICEIMGYRAIDLSKIKDKDERNKYKRLQRQFALPDNRSEEEKERDFADAFW